MRNLFICLLLLSPCLSSARWLGPGGSGGGNIEEADFVAKARQIHAELKAVGRLGELKLMTSSEEFEWAIRNTQVQCASLLQRWKMRRLNKRFYYFAFARTIAIDCGYYTAGEALADPLRVLIFHEYLRVLGREGSQYLYSSQLPAALSDAPCEMDLILSAKGYTPEVLRRASGAMIHL